MNQILCGQFPDPVIQNLMNQQVTRTVKLIIKQCVLTRNVKLPNVTTKLTKTVK